MDTTYLLFRDLVYWLCPKKEMRLSIEMVGVLYTDNTFYSWASSVSTRKSQKFKSVASIWFFPSYIIFNCKFQVLDYPRHPSAASSTLVELTSRLDFFKERRSQLMEQLHNLDLNYGTTSSAQDFMYKPSSPTWNWRRNELAHNLCPLYILSYYST